MGRPPKAGTRDQMRWKVRNDIRGRAATSMEAHRQVQAHTLTYEHVCKYITDVHTHTSYSPRTKDKNKCDF